MSTTQTTNPTGESGQATWNPAYRLTLPRVIHSEWIKLRSVRSTAITLGFAAIAVAAFGLLISIFGSGAAIGDGPDGNAIYDPAGNALFGTIIAQVVMGVVGALFFTSEYATGAIRATFTAVPKRLPVLWAKGIVVAIAALIAMAAAVAVAYFGGKMLYDGQGEWASLSDPGVLRALIGAALFPTAIAVMGVALGALVRHTAMAVSILFGVLFVAPLLFSMFSWAWVSDVVPFLPSEAGQAMSLIVSNPDQLSPLAAFGVTMGWVGVLLASAAITLKRRDT